MPDNQNILPIPGMDATNLPAIQRMPDGVDDDGEVICSSCVNSHDADDSSPTTADSSYVVCPDCRICCESCGDIYCDGDSEIGIAVLDNGNRASSSHAPTEIRCDSCAFACYDCKARIYDHSGGRNSSGDNICQRCAENYYSCDHCGDIIYSDDTFYADDSTYCQGCYTQRVSDDEDSDNSSRLIHSHEYKPKAVLYAAAGEVVTAHTPYFGVEIETEGGETDEGVESCGLDKRADFYVKKDGSLDDGFEIVSHPCTLKRWLEIPLDFCDKLRSNGYRSYDTETCGMHVHVSRSHLSPAACAKLLLFAKSNRHFVQFISRRKDEKVLASWSAIDHGSTGHIVRKAKALAGMSHNDRYTAINLLNSKTVEFRIFRGTLCLKSIRRNVALVAALCAWIRNAPVNKLGWLDFRRWIDREGRKYVGKDMRIALLSWMDTYTPAALRYGQIESSAA